VTDPVEALAELNDAGGAGAHGIDAILRRS